MSRHLQLFLAQSTREASSVPDSMSEQNQFDNMKNHSLVHLVVAAFSGAKTHPPQAGQPVLELALSAETSAIGVN